MSMDSQQPYRAIQFPQSNSPKTEGSYQLTHQPMPLLQHQKLWRLMLSAVTAVSFIVAIWFFTTNIQTEQQAQIVSAELNQSARENLELSQENDRSSAMIEQQGDELKAQAAVLDTVRADLVAAQAQLAKRNGDVAKATDGLVTMQASLDASALQVNQLQQQLATATAVRDSLQKQVNDLQFQVALLQAQVEQASGSDEVIIDGNQIRFSLDKLTQGRWTWTVPLNSLRQTWQQRPYVPPIAPENVQNNSDRFNDIRVFIDPEPFVEIMIEVDKKTASIDALLQEVKKMMSQLQVIDPRNLDTPQFPLETLVQMKGDGEDLAILMASLLTASERSWQVNLVYFDENSLDQPYVYNRVLIQIEATDRDYWLDPTNTMTLENMQIPANIQCVVFKIN